MWPSTGGKARAPAGITRGGPWAKRSESRHAITCARLRPTHPACRARSPGAESVPLHRNWYEAAAPSGAVARTAAQCVIRHGDDILAVDSRRPDGNCLHAGAGRPLNLGQGTVAPTTAAITACADATDPMPRTCSTAGADTIQRAVAARNVRAHPPCRVKDASASTRATATLSHGFHSGAVGRVAKQIQLTSARAITAASTTTSAAPTDRSPTFSLFTAISSMERHGSRFAEPTSGRSAAVN